MSRSKVIAIDGPSGSGKSTIAKAVASKLSLTYLDTGAMFRAVAYALDSAGIKVEEIDRISDFLSSLHFEYAPEKNILIRLNSDDLTSKIREHHVSGLASKYSVIPEIRDYLKEAQRKIAAVRPSILEGRDIGTVIFPDAIIKVFLTADPKIRGQRRFDQLKDLGKDMAGVTVDSLISDIEARDEADSSRNVAPLTKADDAVEIDTTTLSIDEVIQKIADLYTQNQAAFS